MKKNIWNILILGKSWHYTIFKLNKEDKGKCFFIRFEGVS
jgi:hypothetical protein